MGFSLYRRIVVLAYTTALKMLNFFCYMHLRIVCVVFLYYGMVNSWLGEGRSIHILYLALVHSPDGASVVIKTLSQS
jgi:hypothetical protein